MHLGLGAGQGGGAGLGWAGLGAELAWGWGLGGWGLGAGGWGSPETEIGLFENGNVVSPPKYELSNGQQQQAISIYFFLEGLGFRVRGLGL